MSQTHIKGMDGIRALGVLMVLISHLWPRPNSILDVFHFGRVGVVLFFVISGFLVTRSLLKLRSEIESNSSTKRSAISVFYYRRILRIFPLYFLALAYLYFIAREVAVTTHLPWLIFYLSNYSFFFDISFGSADHFWTLAVEEQFYLIIPLLVIYLSPRRSYHWITGMLISGMLIKAAFAYSFAARGGIYVWNYSTHPLWGCVEGLCLGALLAYKPASVSWIGSGKALLIGGGILLLASVYYSLNLKYLNQDALYSSLAHLCYAVASLTLIAYTIKRQGSTWVNILEWRLVSWVGRVSYGIYVIHYIARPGGVEWVTQNKQFFPIEMQPYLLFIVVSLFSLGLASLSFLLIEKPILSLKNMYWGTALSGLNEKREV